MKKNRGFTLIELLATVVLLSVIALITVPSVIRLIKQAEKDSFLDSATGLIESAILYNTEHAGEKTELNLAVQKELRTLKFKGTPPEGGTLYINEDGDIALKMYNDKYCAIKQYNDKRVNVYEKENIKCEENIN